MFILKKEFFVAFLSKSYKLRGNMILSETI